MGEKIINEALRNNYEDIKVEELTIQEFRERYMGVKFRKIWSKGNILGSLPDVKTGIDFNKLEEAVVRFLPFSNTVSDFVDAAVVVDKNAKPVIEFKLYASHFLGVFYVAGGPGDGKGAKNIDLIYDDLKKKPINN